MVLVPQKPWLGIHSSLAECDSLKKHALLFDSISYDLALNAVPEERNQREIEWLTEQNFLERFDSNVDYYRNKNAFKLAVDSIYCRAARNIREKTHRTTNQQIYC